jgi:hypothetical protein
LQFGADRTGATDSFAAFQAHADYESTRDTRLFACPPGKYSVSAPTQLGNFLNMFVSPGAEITATAAMTAIFIAGDTTSTFAEERVYACHAYFDCAALADTPFWLRHTQECSLFGYKSIAPLKYGVQIGDLSAPGAAFGNYIYDIESTRQLGATNDSGPTKINAGTVGVFNVESRSSDNKFSMITMVGFDKGWVAGGASLANNVHVWASSDANRMSTGFEPSASSSFIACFADKPEFFAFDIQKFRIKLVGCLHLNATAGPSTFPGAISVRIDPTVDGFSCFGFESRGDAVGIAKDFDLDETNNTYEILGTTRENVTTSIRDRVGSVNFIGVCRANNLRITNSVDGTDEFNSSYDEGAGRYAEFSADMGKNVRQITSAGVVHGQDTSTKQAFYGATPINRPSGVAVTAAAIHAALVSLGLISA